MTIEGLKDVGNKYYQTVLSGWGDFIQSPNQDSDSTQDKQATPPITQEFWQQKSYQILVPIIIKPAELPNSEYSYEVQIAIDRHIPLSPDRPKSKKLSGQIVDIPPERKRDQNTIYLVYGVDKEGVYSLSHTAEHTTQRNIAYLCGRILGHIDRTVQLLVYNSSRQEETAMDTGQHDQTAQTQENLGKPEKRKRREGLRKQIRSETPSEARAVVVEANG